MANVSYFYCLSCDRVEKNLDFKRDHINPRDGWGRPLEVGKCPFCGFEYAVQMSHYPEPNDDPSYLKHLALMYYGPNGRIHQKF